MTTFPNSPRLTNGAIVGIDKFNPLASVIVFQYNPDTVTRTLTAQTSGDNGEQSEAFRIKGPPQETIKLDVEIDAADQLETAGFTATKMGLYPTLGALEMLLYPKSLQIFANEVLAKIGVIEIIPPQTPFTLLIWGLKRVLPVRLNQFTITEEAFDPTLNPIRANVSLDLRVLTYQDLGFASVGGALYMVNQVAKEAMATIGSLGNITSLPGTLRI
jgi:hypothetical protein